MRTRTLVPALTGLVVVAIIVFAGPPVYSALTGGADLLVDAVATDGSATGALQLVTVDTRGFVATGTAGVADFVRIPGDPPAPGHTVGLRIGVADNDPDSAAVVTVAVLPLAAHPSRTAAGPQLTDLLRVTVVDSTTGSLLIGDSATDPSAGAPLAEAAATIDLLSRHTRPLHDGDDWTPGAAGSRHDLEIAVYCPDTPEARALTAADAELALMLYGTPLT